MCGIAGYIAKEGNGVPFLMNALEVLKTRGYDGFGIAIQGSDIIKAGNQQLEYIKAVLAEKTTTGTVGIAHNRWATHGVANVANAHPHVSGDITVVHNGDLDNYEELKLRLTEKGYTFISETDTEVFAVLVSEERKSHDFFTSVKRAILQLGPTSTYAFLIMDNSSPGQIIATRKGSRPLLWSLKDGLTYIASEESALNGFVQSYQEIFEGDIALFEAGKLLMRENMTDELEEKFRTYEIDPNHYVQPEKTSKFWMYQEMMEAVSVIEKAIGKRATDRGVVLGGIGHPDIQRRLRKIKKFFIAGCGTSYYAAQIIAECLQEIAGIEAEAIIASEAISRSWVFDSEITALVVVSQSGETADVASLMLDWKQRGLLMLGIVNKPNTQIPKLTDAGIYCHIGKEIAVASTKAFLGEVVCGIMFAISMGQQRGLSNSKRDEYIKELRLLSKKAEQVLSLESEVEKLAKKYSHVRNFLYMGRKYNAVVASEGALKLKEITWKDDVGGIHALGIPAGEMKHGTLAMIDKDFPTFVIAPNDSVFLATMNNVAEIRARRGPVVLITNDPNKISNIHSSEIILIPETLEFLSPILSVIVLQMFAFFVAIERGCNPDMPRNLAKSVTVE